MYYLQKLLPLFFDPIFIIMSILFLFIAIRKITLIFILIFFCYLISNPIIANSFNKYMEIENTYTIDEIPNEFSNIIVLSGYLKNLKINEDRVVEWQDADRFFAAINIYKKFHNKKIIFTNENLPWAEFIHGNQILIDKANEMGVSKSDLFITEPVKNTFDESLAVKKLNLKNNNIILITSAYHMNRAKLIFEKSGFNVFPYPVDFRHNTESLNILSFFPSSNAILSNSVNVRELLGRFYYKFFI